MLQNLSVLSLTYQVKACKQSFLLISYIMLQNLSILSLTYQVKACKQSFLLISYITVYCKKCVAFCQVFSLRVLLHVPLRNLAAHRFAFAGNTRSFQAVPLTIL